MLKESGLQTYDRGGKTAGIVLKNYKFRLSRLGFTEEKFEELEKIKNKENVLQKVRKLSITKMLER